MLTAWKGPSERGEAKWIARAIRDAGFAYVALDLEGYRTISMNEALGKTAAGGDGGNG